MFYGQIKKNLSGTDLGYKIKLHNYQRNKLMKMFN